LKKTFSTPSIFFWFFGSLNNFFGSFFASDASTMSAEPNASIDSQPIQLEAKKDQNESQRQMSTSPKRDSDEPHTKRRNSSASSRSSSGSRRSRSRSPRSRNSRNRSPRHSPSNRTHPAPSKCLGVFGLSSHTSQADLRDEFSRYGEVVKVDLIVDQRTQRSRCFGFVYFSSVEDATRAKEACNGMKFHGKNIRTDYSITERPHTPTPGEYKGRRTHRSDRYPPHGRDRYDDRYYDDRDRYERDRYYRSRDRYDDRYYDDRDRYERGRYHHDERDYYYRRDHY